MTKPTSSPKKTFGTASSLQKTELEGARYSGSDEVLVIIKIFKLFSRPHMSSKYGVSYTVGKLFIILVRICKIWVTKPNYLVARGLQSWKKKVQFHKSISSKNFFLGWVNTITQGAFRITFDLIGIWPLTASKPPKRIFSQFFNLQGPLATK